MTADAPTGTVTFLFTDLEGSTRLWEEHPESMRGALKRHDELLHAAVETHGGYLVKTTGDGIHAAFATADDAVAAAIAAQEALTFEEWGSTGPLRIRMGIHTGSAELRDRDYYGPALNRAARLMAVAHGEQIVISNATEELVRDDLAVTIGIEDLGEHRFRDLGRPERVFQVNAPELRTLFPPLRSLDAFPGNLPIQGTSFVGRGEELRQISEAFDEARLVTLTGVGGVGKTRLATHVAAGLLPRFRHGAWICELAAIDDERSVLDLISGVLRVQPAPGAASDVGLLEFLHDRELLLLLDNCEHVLSVVSGFASEVLRTCPRVQILATSREPLGIDGEQAWPIGPLPVVGKGEDTNGDAVRLFRDRARSVNPRLSMDREIDATIAEICARIDGIPLAIELAAARIASMSPRDIAAHLDERFRLLSTKRRGDDARHQTLAATIDWSFRLLDAVEQRVFERLSVFAGSFDGPTAEAVVSGDGIEAWDVVDALSGLVTKSMVVADQAVSAGTRYELLETLREYGRRRLDDRGDSEAWLRRTAQHYVQFVERPEFRLRGPDELEWIQRLMLEMDNIRSCLGWALGRADDADVTLGLRIVAGVARLVTMAYGYGLAEIGVWARRASELVSAGDRGLACTILGMAAWNAVRQGDADAARRFAEASLPDPRLRMTGTAPEIPFSALSMVEAASGNHARALEIVQRGCRELEDAGADRDGILSLHNVAAAWAAACGDFETARTEAQLGLEMARVLRSPSLLASSLFTLGLALERDDIPGAIAALEESVEWHRRGGYAATAILSRTLSTLAHVRARTGDAAGALRTLREAVDDSVQHGQSSELVAAIDRGSSILVRIGAPEPAAVFAGVARRGPLAAVNTSIAAGWAEAREGRLRVALGDTVFEAASTQGAAMSHDEVVDYAIGEIDRCLAELGDEGEAGAG